MSTEVKLPTGRDIICNMLNCHCIFLTHWRLMQTKKNNKLITTTQCCNLRNLSGEWSPSN